ncbi:Coagulation factor 5/8 type domain protein [Candidatus Sulfotelmatomonas gaucii]|uniref:Coagulation factor 5/8 type domain protein n=1 Tax=Candidatus Sulfuritelmatomonas gaucii TaxID=2043161 RepID=A0A2N9LEC3_9BACT|nr:Coagulation factor 5/8 type domain protein [Candidatus Sulfotelmatomonas gaucii]
MKRHWSFFCVLFCLVCTTCYSTQAQVPAAPQQDSTAQRDPLFSGFLDPPNGARPRVWWHWMNGNISEQGIKLDLDWMHRVGLGGVTIFEGAINTPQVVPHRLIYMTPEWKQAFDDAVTTARSLGLEVAIASSPGWSETGGPWVPAAQGMKKMVWSATQIEGGKPFKSKLPHPPQVDGTFQNFSVPGRRAPDGKIVTPPEFYADAAVIAYKIPEGDKPQPELNPQVASSGGAVNVPELSDGDVDTVAIDLPASEPGREGWVQFDYGHPQTIQAVTLASLGDAISVFDHESKAIPPLLEASDDGVSFHKVSDIPFSSLVQTTTSFDAVTARYFRVVFPAQPAEVPEHNHRITELVLASGARANEWEKRAGFANARNFYDLGDPTVTPQLIVPQDDVIDLTSKMSPDGALDWTPPAGNWMVLRIGYSLTGHENGPAPAEATGLEVDKLNRDYVKNYLDGYLKMYSDIVGPELMGKDGISYLLTDSIEVGPQNWTDHILDEFKQRRGYDPCPWLPALTGVVIKSTADTGRFLWDFRRTLSQLLAENHYGEIADDLHAHGLRYYGEALEYHRPSLGDDMEMRSKTDVPMGAMWTYAGFSGPDFDYISDLRGAASVAHIYGQNLVGAESMTSRGPAWSFSPNTLKKVADLEFALGVNRFEIHESAHQPVPDMAPGLTLGPYGLWFNRNQTWADEAKPWVTYLARCSYLLQQGHYAAAAAYFYGEEGPLTAVFGWKPIDDAPDGYAFDFVNSDVILHQLAVKDGRLVTPGGTSYRVLYLGGRSQRMTLPVLRKIDELVRDGAILVGNRPTDSPSLADDEKELQRIADELWGKASAQTKFTRKVGKGRVYVGMSANAVLADLDVQRDFEYTRPESDTSLMFLHRKLSDGDLYFVDNRQDRAEDVNAFFRVDGKTPELWDAATGKTQPASYQIANARTTVPLHLDPYGTTFVVFRDPAAATSRQIPKPAETRITDLDDALNQDWDVRFQSDRGAPDSAHFDRLTSWSASANDGVKYFSGTATYSKTIEVPESVLKPGAQLWLDLGEVNDIADVSINGKDLGIAWKTPFRIDVTDALKPGSNQIDIQVTNLWVNRMIGDQQPWALKKYTFTDFTPYKADSPLLRSGLLGPVRLLSLITP